MKVNHSRASYGLFCFLCLLWKPMVLSLQPLNEYIQFYELTNLRRLPSRRSANTSETRLGFEAFNKQFVLDLKTDDFILSSDADIFVHKKAGVHKINTDKIRSNLMIGKVNSHPNSFVHGLFNGHHLDAALHYVDDIYYIEPAERYFRKQNKTFNTIIYRDADIKGRNCSGKGCLVDGSPFVFDQPPELKPRVFRPIKNYYQEPESNVCRFIAVADHTFMEKTVNGSIEEAVNEMTFIFREADHYWSQYDFNDDGKPDGLRMQLGRIELFDDPNVSTYPYGTKVIDTAQEYLRTMTKSFNFGEFCLSVMFCQRTFRGGTLGLAPVAEPGANTVGGICEQWHSKMQVSPNCLIVTREVNNRLFPKFRSVFTLIHEVGHTFGAPHDPLQDVECAPSDIKGGKYIMSPTTLANQQPNNILFSPCSKKKILVILEKRAYCFKKGIGPICGNMLIEGKEQCDCGYKDSCNMVDHCCVRADSEGSKPGPCQLTQDSRCSAREPCCNAQCDISPARERKVCRKGTECLHPATCNGRSSSCPKSIPRAEGISCDGGLGHCRRGACVTSICRDLGHEDCKCPDGMFECWVCCKIKGHCWHLDFGGPFGDSDDTIPLHPKGSLCNLGKGTCDESGVCLSTQYLAPHLEELEEEEQEEEGIELRKKPIDKSQTPRDINIKNEDTAGDEASQEEVEEEEEEDWYENGDHKVSRARPKAVVPIALFLVSFLSVCVNRILNHF